MKITATPEQIASIQSALRALYVRTFECKSCDPKHDAQRNLDGITHYVEDDTLRWHKCKVLSSRHIADGLLFLITTSDALDMNNSKRGFRCVVFDVFGTTVYRPELQDAFTNRKAAEKALSEQTFDIVAHYREAISQKVKSAQDELARTQEALGLMAAA